MNKNKDPNKAVEQEDRQNKGKRIESNNNRKVQMITYKDMQINEMRTIGKLKKGKIQDNKRKKLQSLNRDLVP